MMDGTRAVVIHDLGYYVYSSMDDKSMQRRVTDILNLKRNAEIALPQQSGGRNGFFTLCSSPTPYQSWVFFQPQPSNLTFTWTFESLYPFSISAVIVPIFNVKESASLREEHNFFLRKLVSWAIHSSHKKHQLPVIVICLNDEGAEPFADFSDDEWWILPKYREKLSDDPSKLEYMRELKNNLYLLEHNIGDADFPTTFFELLRNISAPQAAQSSSIWLDSEGFVIPHLENVIIQHEHIGTGKGAAYGFVVDCLKGLSGKTQQFRIWIHAVESPEHAYHLYVEYEGLAHDGLMAFQRPMNTVEYQSSLNSTWRTYIDITPEMTLDEAKEKLNDIIQRIKDGVLEEE